ncbi:MAG: hypothetical protein GY847_02695 [Proteobacteria bacterium]|nr:hypothetical protein [Pseudomonadota bacterium]
MKRVILDSWVLFCAIFAATQVFAQNSKSTDDKSQAVQEEAVQEGADQEEGALPDASQVFQETSLDDCRDEKDNDGDGHVDCEDQDCLIYAICIKATSSEEDESTLSEEPAEPAFIPESGLLCRDGKDNNTDGLVDCHEVTCQRYAYCRKKMYFLPESPNKAPGLIVSMGIGLALPNFRTPTAEAESDVYNTDIPFDPDIGFTGNLMLGFLPLKWIGFGIDASFAATGATNQHEYIFSRDDPDEYKYIGYKNTAHVGGFIRFQWPFGRFVPFINIAGGYSVAKYKWKVYEPSNDWDDIDTWNDESDIDGLSGLTGEREINSFTSRHFTFAFKPGFDVFVVKRMFAIGMHAWLPVVASNESSTDNVGILVHLTVTPMWREHRQLKPEYNVAVAGQQHKVQK